MVLYFKLPENDNGIRIPSLNRTGDLDRVVSGLSGETHDRVANVVKNMKDKEKVRVAKRDEHADGEHGEGDHGASGHGAPAGKSSNPIRNIEVDYLDLKKWFGSLKEASDAFAEGVLDKPTLSKAVDDFLSAIKFPGSQKLRWGLPLIMWGVAKVFNLPDHKPAPTKVDYDNLSTQILTMHNDHGKPNSFHHGMVGLLTGMGENELRDNYSSFFEHTTFSSGLKSADGRKELKTEFQALFGKKIKTRAQFLVRSRQMLQRMGATFVSAAPDSAVAHMHPMRERHASHSLHVLQTAIVNARTWVTDANIGQITKEVEDIKLNKDLQKTGDTLMEHVKGNTDLATQFLGNINMPAFDKAFHSIFDDTALEDSMYTEPDLVKESICQLFNFSPKENITTADLNNFTAALIGPIATPTPPAGAPAGTPPPAPTVPYTLDPENGGALGPLSAIPATDTATRTKWAELRQRINDARNRLLSAPIGTPAPAAGVTPPTRLSLLFPPRSVTLKYNEFGLQLGREVRGKSGVNIQRARSAFLRGLEEDEFRNDFMTLIDNPTLVAAAAGTKAEKDAVKAKIIELTGLKAPKVTPTMFRQRMEKMREDLGTMPLPAAAVDADVVGKRGALDALLVLMTPAIEGQINSLYLDINLEEKLGEGIQTASDAATTSAVFDRIDGVLLMGHYSQVMQAEATVMGMSLLNQQRFKAQLAAFIGAPKNFVWNNITYGAMLTGLNTKITMANTVRPPTHPGSTAIAPFITNVSGFSPAFIAHLNTI